MYVNFRICMLSLICVLECVGLHLCMFLFTQYVYTVVCLHVLILPCTENVHTPYMLLVFIVNECIHTIYDYLRYQVLNASKQILHVDSDRLDSSL